MSIIHQARSRATPSRETRAKLRALGKRLEGTEYPDLARPAVAIQALARGERIDVPHFPECTCDHTIHFAHHDGFGRFDGWIFARECDGCDHWPIDCPHCAPLLWVAWTIGAGTEGDLGDLDLGLPRIMWEGKALEDWQAECIRRGREGELPPQWNDEIEKEERQERPRSKEEFHAYVQRLDRLHDRLNERSGELIREIRFGSDPKKAKRAGRSALRKEMTLSVLLRKEP